MWSWFLSGTKPRKNVGKQKGYLWRTNMFFRIVRIIAFVMTAMVFSGCSKAVLTPQPSQMFEKTTSDVINTPNPSRTPLPTKTITPTEWSRVYPIKKAILYYGYDLKTEDNSAFMEWGPFYRNPDLVLYDDGQLVFRDPTDSYFLEKQLSPKETDEILAHLKRLGLPILQEAINNNPDAIFSKPANQDYYPPYTIISLGSDPSKEISISVIDAPNLIQPMKEIISYLESLRNTKASFYQADRLLININNADFEPPLGGAVIPWPDEIASPFKELSYWNVLYLEGKDAKSLFAAAGGKTYGYFVIDGKKYLVFLRPVFPHECHTYNYYPINDSPPAQIPFICDETLN
jgi:hypothetical protein